MSKLTSKLTLKERQHLAWESLCCVPLLFCAFTWLLVTSDSAWGYGFTSLLFLALALGAYSNYRIIKSRDEQSDVKE